MLGPTELWEPGPISGDDGDGEPVIVSIGVLPLERQPSTQGSTKDLIFPNDKFTLDIFVFNKSSWMRRFEVTYPDARMSRKTGSQRLGIIPLENRIRVGPLRPSTCQSVRMDFLALMPGVHPVDVLTLTDVETGYAVNLRCVVFHLGTLRKFMWTSYQVRGRYCGT